MTDAVPSPPGSGSFAADGDVNDLARVERVVVALPADDRGTMLLQRMVDSDRCGSVELVCVHVVHGDTSSTGVKELGELRRRASAVGASLHVVEGVDVVETVLGFTRRVGAAHLMLGVDREGAWWPLASRVRTSLGGAADVPRVHLVDITGNTPAWRSQGFPHGLTRRRRVLGWLAAVGLPAVVTVACLAAGMVLGRGVALLLVLAVVGVALIGGLGAALLSVVVAAGLLNYFFIPPTHHFAVMNAAQLLGLVCMLVVAVSVALVVHHAARLRDQAVQARAEAGLLTEFATTLLTASTPLPLVVDKVRVAFGVRSAALLQRDETGWRRLAGAGPDPADHPADGDGDADAGVDVAVATDVHLVLRGRVLSAEQQRVLRAVAGQTLLALQAQQLAADAAEARRRAEMTELRSALLSAVGHDLRTPLTAIKAAVGSLRDPDLQLSPVNSAAQLATAAECADRLQDLVDNLLDSARLATGAVRPQLRPVGYDDVLARALSFVDRGHLVDVQVDDTVPPVLADPGLLERVLANLVANALTHGGGCAVTARAGVRGDRVDLLIVDYGPGIPVDRLDAVFTPFQRRGDRDPRHGVGLGLAVARGFTEAMGGSLTAQPTPGGGLTVMVSLPSDPTWPTEGWPTDLDAEPDAEPDTGDLAARDLAARDLDARDLDGDAAEQRR